MKRITFSADEKLIQQARQQAASENRSLNDLFREWLENYVAEDRDYRVEKFNELMSQLGHVQSGGPFSRDEMSGN